MMPMVDFPAPFGPAAHKNPRFNLQIDSRSA
jgi:hypothetical protein